MKNFNELLTLTKSTAQQAGEFLLKNRKSLAENYRHAETNDKEIKSLADQALEKIILEKLKVTGLSILSEEAGEIGDQTAEYRFIVDPLDGTFNFVKNLGPCAVSIALWKKEIPIFGVIYDLQSQQLAWGGKILGAFVEDEKGIEKIAVSKETEKSKSAICTGFPARFNTQNQKTMDEFFQRIGAFAKVRMLGCASIALLLVAKGAAEVAMEDNTMLWDVAAGLAIVEGAGGDIQVVPAQEKHCLNINASNALIN